MHYSRWKRGRPLDKPEERRGLCLTERLWQYVDVGRPDECWEWTAHRNDGGYGQFVLYPPDSPSKRTVQAHRIAWETFWRTELSGLACHRCNNPPCCNPLHIYDGTFATNAADSVRAGTAYFLRPDMARPRGSGNGRSKLDEGMVREIRRRYAAGGISQQSLADEFGVSQTKISDVVRYRTWTHVE